MLTYDFQKAEGPMYAYVYQCIKEDIIKGNLQPGEKLPSKRTFAHNNGISTITIQNAYDQLISEGYVYTLPKGDTMWRRLRESGDCQRKPGFLWTFTCRRKRRTIGRTFPTII